MAEERVLGVDPGLAATGYAVVAGSTQGFRVLTAGTVRTRPNTPLPERLGAIYDALAQVVEAFQPQAVALEEVYLARNAPSAMATAEVVGVVKLLARGRDLHTFAPRQVKRWICGSGAAPKEQMIRMVEDLAQVQELGPDHAADAVAVAICALLERSK